MTKTAGAAFKTLFFFLLLMAGSRAFASDSDCDRLLLNHVKSYRIILRADSATNQSWRITLVSPSKEFPNNTKAYLEVIKDNGAIGPSIFPEIPVVADQNLEKIVSSDGKDTKWKLNLSFKVYADYPYEDQYKQLNLTLPLPKLDDFSSGSRQRYTGVLLTGASWMNSPFRDNYDGQFYFEHITPAP
jgi:hypothetical protein